MSRRGAVAVIREQVILALNSGSSSLKFGLYARDGDKPIPIAAGAIEAIGSPTRCRFRATDRRGKEIVDEACRAATPLDAIVRVARLLADSSLPVPLAIGHRVVHGGPTLSKPCAIDDTVLAAIEAASVLAPLHGPATVEIIRHTMALFPGHLQVACFDSGFHARLPELARRLPISRALHDAGIRRYGFHGLSCESVLRQIGPPNEAALPERIVIAHLGHGASVTAVRNGRSIDTSMGLTPGGGLPMGSRSGDLDPGVLLYLMRDPAWTRERLEALVDRESGLLGVSGISGDLRQLHAVAGANADARLAIAMFCLAVAKQIAAMIAVMDGIDLLIFTGGIGEHDAIVRSAVCARLGWFGISIYPKRNAETVNPLSAGGSRCRVLVLPSQEAAQIARQVTAVMQAPPTGR